MCHYRLRSTPVPFRKGMCERTTWLEEPEDVLFRFQAKKRNFLVAAWRVRSAIYLPILLDAEMIFFPTVLSTKPFDKNTHLSFFRSWLLLHTSLVVVNALPYSVLSGERKWYQVVCLPFTCARVRVYIPHFAPVLFLSRFNSLY